MPISLSSRAARACAAALVFSFGLTPSFARTSGPGGASFARPAFGAGHSPHFAPRGFNRRFDFNHFGVNRFSSKQFYRFGSNRFGRFGFDRFGNQLFIDGWGWDGWGGVPVSTGVSEPIILGSGAPVIINVGDPLPSGAGSEGGCVVHKLIYDSAGKYVGERQSSQC
jgi:hypothetical protein